MPPFRHTFLLLTLGLGLGACGSAPPAALSERDPGATEAIRAVLDAQVAAWNRGSLRGFMDGYARTDSLRFASGGTVRRGWQAALDGYVRGYPDKEAMGTLRFDSLDVQVLSPSWAVVFGRWRLQRAADAPNGLFTLLFHKRPDGWRIVHDHTSAAD
jgi:ketosteroid isomerase-like protein